MSYKRADSRRDLCDMTRGEKNINRNRTLEERYVHKLYDLPILMHFLGKNGEKTSGGARSTAHVFSHGVKRPRSIEANWLYQHLRSRRR